MVTNCEIKFDNSPSATFLSGQMITGKVVLNLTEKKKIRCKLFHFFYQSSIQQVF